MSAATTLPTLAFNTDPRPSLGSSLTAWDQMVGVLGGNIATAPIAVVRLDSNGSLSLTSPNCRVLPESEGDEEDGDEMRTIALDTLADGRMVCISCGAGGAPITVKHLANGGAGNGEITLAAGADVILTNPSLWLLLQRNGNVISERHIGGTASPGRVGPLVQDIDMAGYGAYGGRYVSVDVTASSRELTPADIGKKLKFRHSNGACVLPMEQPASGRQWAVDDFVMWEQIGANLRFETTLSGVPTALGSHDRGAGPTAQGMVWLRALDPFDWALGGATSPAPEESDVVRQWLRQEVTTTVTTDAASTAWKTAVTLTHTPADNERWLYLGAAGWGITGGAASNAAMARMTNGGTGPTAGPIRYAANRDALGLILAREYGTAPGAQSITMELMAGSASFSATLTAPEIQAIRLEDGEFVELVTGTTTNIPNTGSYADIVTMTETLVDGDYIAVAFGEWSSTQQVGATLALDVGGGEQHIKVMSRNGAYQGIYSVLFPFSALAGSKTIKLKGKSNGAHQSGLRHCGIVLLRADLFQDVKWVNDSTVSGPTSSTTYADKVSTTHALQSGWNYLALGDVDLWLSAEGSSAGTKGRMIMNGTQISAEANSMPRENATWTPMSAWFQKIVQASAATDTFAVQYASRRVDETVQAQEASIVLLALAPAA